MSNKQKRAEPIQVVTAEVTPTVEAAPERIKLTTIIEDAPPVAEPVIAAAPELAEEAPAPAEPKPTSVPEVKGPRLSPRTLAEMKRGQEAISGH